MVITCDMTVFVENMRREEANRFWSMTRKVQRFSAPVLGDMNPPQRIATPLSKHIHVPLSFTRANEGDLKVGHIVRYTDRKIGYMFCMVTRISDSGKSFRKEDGYIKDNVFYSSGVQNETNKDILNVSRVLHIVVIEQLLKVSSNN